MGIVINVKDNDIEKALRHLKREAKTSGLFLDIKKKECYKKPSEARKSKKNVGKIRNYYRNLELNPDYSGKYPFSNKK
jgi:ribosomal protein S21